MPSAHDAKGRLVQSTAGREKLAGRSVICDRPARVLLAQLAEPIVLQRNLQNRLEPEDRHEGCRAVLPRCSL